MVAAALLVLFGGYLQKGAARGGGEGHMLSSVVLAGATIVAVGPALDATLSVALVETVDDIEPIGVQALNALWNNDYIVIGLGAFDPHPVSRALDRPPRGAAEVAGLGRDLFAVIAVTPIGFAGVVGAALGFSSSASCWR